MAETHDQTYIEALGADLAQQNLNVLVLAQNGDNQLGQPWTDHLGHHPGHATYLRGGSNNPTPVQEYTP